jgi:very-short-patch-repair endonuclease
MAKAKKRTYKRAAPKVRKTPKSAEPCYDEYDAYAPPVRTRRSPRPGLTVAGQFELLMLSESINLSREVRFHPTRRWRFDYANIVQKIAVEIEGGVFTRGRHTRGKGYIEDCVKYNAAAALGWRVLRIASSGQFEQFLHDYKATLML